jgi:hypothetical protein
MNRLFRRHNCAANLQDAGWQIFDPKGWQAYREGLAVVAKDVVSLALRGGSPVTMAAGVLAAMYDELGPLEFNHQWQRLTQLRLCEHHQAIAARRLLAILARDEEGILAFCSERSP